MEEIGRLREWIERAKDIGPGEWGRLFIADLKPVLDVAEKAIADQPNGMARLLESILLDDAFIGKLAERLANMELPPPKMVTSSAWKSLSPVDAPGFYKPELPAEQTAADHATAPPVDAETMLRKHQWAGTAHGHQGTTAFRCPECNGIRPGDSLMFSREKLIIGNGHKPGCLLAAAIGEPVGK